MTAMLETRAAAVTAPTPAPEHDLARRRLALGAEIATLQAAAARELAPVRDALTGPRGDPEGRATRDSAERAGWAELRWREEAAARAVREREWDLRALADPQLEALWEELETGRQRMMQERRDYRGMRLDDLEPSERGKVLPLFLRAMEQARALQVDPAVTDATSAVAAIRATFDAGFQALREVRDESRYPGWNSALPFSLEGAE